MKLDEIAIPGLGTVDNYDTLERQVRGMFNDLAKRANDPNVDWGSLKEQLGNSAFHAYLEALANAQSSKLGTESSNDQI